VPRLARALALAAALCLCLFAPDRAPADAPAPFAPGERLTYEISWAFITAGTGVLEVLPDTVVGGVPARHYRATAQSTPFIDTFYRLRDRMDAYTDLSVRRSLFYDKKQQEGDYKRDIVLSFDWSKGVLHRYKQGEYRDSMTLDADTLDPLSMLFAFRSQRLEVGFEFRSPVTDGKEREIGTARVVARETVRTRLGSFDTFLVEPHMERVGTVFKTAPGAKLQIWITADERKIPVKVKSKVAIGHVTMELVRIEPGPPG
jgi:hypothetical protein